MNINDAKAGLKKRLGFAPDFFNKLDKKKKILFVSGAVICLVITIMLIRFVTKSSIVPLYTDIDLRDAAAITEYLEDKNISYELKDEGGTILVPEDQKYQIRLDLANNGLPQGNVIGFESFDDVQNITITIRFIQFCENQISDVYLAVSIHSFHHVFSIGSCTEYKIHINTRAGI